MSSTFFNYFELFFSFSLTISSSAHLLHPPIPFRKIMIRLPWGRQYTGDFFVMKSAFKAVSIPTGSAAAVLGKAGTSGRSLLWYVDCRSISVRDPRSYNGPSPLAHL